MNTNKLTQQPKNSIMKKFALMILALPLFLTANLFANDDFEITVGDSYNCYWECDYKYPSYNKHYNEGEDVYVRIDPKKYQDIEWMELYCNGHLVRKEMQYPYEWCNGSGNSDHYLRNMKAGTYKLKCKIKTKCGEYYEKFCTIYVDGGDYGGGGGYGNCNYECWFYNCKPYYNEGEDVYVKVEAKKHQDIEWMELYCNGKLVRKETTYPYEWCKGSGNSDGYLRNMKPGNYKLFCKVKDKCGDYHEYYCEIVVKPHGGGGGHDHCEWNCWFEYPKSPSGCSYGKPLYVKFTPKKYHDIEWVELYCDGKLIRKETQYPYEWCKGSGNSDYYLRSLKKGQHKLMAKWLDKCGDYHQEYYSFNVN